MPKECGDLYEQGWWVHNLNNMVTEQRSEMDYLSSYVAMRVVVKSCQILANPAGLPDDLAWHSSTLLWPVVA